ncbi:hypothetical protein ACZ11_13975 [Lysinibacillus xylanilyticus]|uniref:Uncharacterized protein n=1 Tax=Lysinibacillus xylanilyticus TaxID=582475 RepID=A0A0K9FFA3_9BACI|nr:hypothetical protein ACZ11_13975 [Lysinibacillus xylanilyticus]
MNSKNKIIYKVPFVTVINIKHNRKKRVKTVSISFARFFVLLNLITEQFLIDIELTETIKVFCIQSKHESNFLYKLIFFTRFSQN